MKVAPTYFADTAFWIALLEANDKFHSRAIAWQRKIVAEHNFLITTDAVLWEMLNYFAAPSARIRAIQLYRACQDREEIGVEPFGQERCEAALALYEQRPDKAWSITDCLSFHTMGLRNLTQALTLDHHFEQAGYEALLLRDPR